MKRGMVVVGSAAVALAVGAVAWYFSRPPRPTPSRSSQDAAAATVRPRTFHPRDHGYVGSQACAECHGEITESYLGTHSMARSFVPLGQETPLEDFARTQFHPPSAREYAVERTDEGTFHHEVWRDVDGQVIYDQRESIQFVLGSGRRGRSYILERDGLLFQSPISWYSQEQRWDLSPGYAPQTHDRFDRKLVLQCFFCHAGLIDVADAASDRYGQPPVAEASIGCERCHGPGREHVERQTRSPTAGEDPTIVNPTRLGAAEREAVCYQCHLRREPTFTVTGKNPMDFRPGQAYDDVWLTFVPAQPRPEDLATLVEQHRSSACFRKSEGKFGCTSCHDPHRQPVAENRDAWYRDRCRKCHGDAGCSLPESRRQAVDNSCIRCHMPTSPTKGIPHTALTDHRLARDPSLLPPTNIGVQRTPDELELFTYDAPRLSADESRRAQALMRAALAAERSQGEWAVDAERLLNPDGLAAAELIRKYDGDFHVLFQLGFAFALQVRPGDARLAWEAALRKEPTHEELLRNLTTMLIRGRDPTAAIPLAERLVAQQPRSAEFFWLLADALRQRGELAEATQWAEKSLERDPTALPIRLWLARAYTELGRSEDSLRQQRTINRMKGWRVE